MVLIFPFKMTATPYVNLYFKYDCKPKVHSEKIVGPYDWNHLRCSLKDFSKDSDCFLRIEVLMRL